jgi:hypothetical protein
LPWTPLCRGGDGLKISAIKSQALKEHGVSQDEAHSLSKDAVRRLSCWLPALLSAALLAASPGHAQDSIRALLRATHWGKSSEDLARQFGAAAISLRQPLDFGDSYAEVVLPRASLGGVPMVAFLQMDKETRGLKRIQLERPPHGVNPPAFRAIMAALFAEFGRPEELCEVPPLPQGGWQAAAEARWRAGEATISAIFRDTTLQAFEGCLFGPASGWCGLHGQILVRIDRTGRGAGPCG